MGTTERRERERKRRWNEIVDAAEKVFFSKGVDAATMDDVAEAAELSKGTLYLYFNSKEDLHYAIALRAMETLERLFLKAVEAAKTGVEKLRAIGATYFHFYHTYPDYFRAMLLHEHTQVDVDNVEPSAMLCLKQGRCVHQIVAAAVQTGIEDDSLRQDLDPWKTALTLWGSATGIIQVISSKDLVLNEFGVAGEDLYNNYMDLMLHALKNSTIYAT